ncbi:MULTISPECIES: MerR family transcriptional regulator [Clostridium]|nr:MULTISPECIES: MerR family transcriptional regulator [Clostridium]AQR97495.1 multidrug-efflux transporter 1 regulator [Clostridium saccharoperbutylacetonicum]
MKKYFSIGEVANFLNISIKALRIYDKMELLKPAYVDPKTSFRYYTMEQFFYLDLIIYLNKYLKVPLKTIKTHMINNDRDDEKLISFLKEQEKNLDKEIEKLEFSKSTLKKKIDELKELQLDKAIGTIYEKYIEERKIFFTHTENSQSPEEVIYSLRKLSAIANHQSFMYDQTLSCIYSFNEYCTTNQLLTKAVGIISDKELRGLNCSIIPSGKYLCLTFKYSEGNRRTSFETFRNYILENKINTEDHMYYLMKAIDISAVSSGDYTTEIQILKELS